jgi:hypothetical protein
MVAVNADAVVRLTRAALPAISPTPAPDYPSRVRPPRQQSRLAVGAQFVIVAGLICPRPIRSIWLSCNRFTKKVDGLSARQGSEIANPEPGSPCGQRDSCIITIIHDAATACRFTGEIPLGRAEQGCWCSYITLTTPYYGTAPAAVYRRDWSGGSIQLGVSRVTARFPLRVLPAGSRVQRAQEGRSTSAVIAMPSTTQNRHWTCKSTLWRVMLKPLTGRRPGVI